MGDETMRHHFKSGEVVTVIPNMFLRHAAPGPYKVLARMPDRDGERMYRIKSPLEEYERVVNENTLTRCKDVLPDEPSERRRVGRRNITLPTLVPSAVPNMASEWDLETVEETDVPSETGAEFSMGAL